jgi:CBS domain-containing protein
VGDIMTPEPEVLDAGAPVARAAERMRVRDIGDIVVVDGGRLVGILTDRDIVIRTLGQGSDPSLLTVGDICSRDPATITPAASVADAVRLVRARAIRRLPVVDDDGTVVGIVSIGDLAVARDRKSALGEISATMPNR